MGFISTPTLPTPMTKSKSMFKTISNVHLETLPDQTWNSCLRIDKMQDSFNSAYVEKVRISFVLNQEETEPNVGLMFATSLDDTLSSTASLNDGKIISASASNGAAGVVSLPVKRSVRSNETPTDTSEAGNPIYVHLRGVAIGESTTVLMVIETWGRWHKATSL